MSLYVALDGPDGCGKSTQAKALVAWLQAAGHRVQHVREPGSTPVGEALRQLLLSPDTGELQPVTEALLFSAARAELVANVIAPALQAGSIVVGERCFVSTLVYQGLAHSPAMARGLESMPGLDPQWLLDLTRRVHGQWLPDAVLLLDVDPDLARSRRHARREDRIEQRGREYHARVRDGFLFAARLEPRARVIDASRSFDEVQADLRRHVGGWLS